MLLGREIIGLPLYNENKKTLLGIVKSYQIDENGFLRFLIITSHSVIARQYRLDSKMIEKIDLSGVYIKSKHLLQKSHGKAVGTSLVGQCVYGADGNALGNITDVFFEGNALSGVELSAGLFSDLNMGRQHLPIVELSHTEQGFIKN